MSRVARLFEVVAGDLERAGYPFALIGGFAVSVRAEPRFTRDVDLVVAVGDDGEAESLVRSLTTRGNTILALVEHDAAKRLATARFLPPGEIEGGVVLDLLFASSSLESEIVAGAEELDVFPGVSVPVARVGHLIALKVLSRDDVHRPQDRAAELDAFLTITQA